LTGRGRSLLAKIRSSTLVREATSKRNFIELVTPIKIMTNVMQNQMNTINNWFQNKESPRRYVSLPNFIPNEEE